MSLGFSLVRRLRAGETVYSAWCRLAVPIVGELLARHGFLAVTLDQQHGIFDFATTIASAAAVHSVDAAAIVRIPIGDNANASRMLDAGVEAIIAPMINTPEDAIKFAAAMKYPPIGRRSWGPHRALAFSGLSDSDYLRCANEVTLAFAMIETRTALRNIVAILETPGIDGVFVSPCDLSITLTNGAALHQTHPEVEEMLNTISDVARKRGKVAGVYCLTAERALTLSRRGFTLLGVASDLKLLSMSAKATMEILHGK